MLSVVSPFSINSLRLRVMVLARRGGSLGFSEVENADAGAEDAEVAGADVGLGFLGGWDEFGSSGPMGGGSDDWEALSGRGRVTITLSPASAAIPPASARTSRTVTGCSA